MLSGQKTPPSMTSLSALIRIRDVLGPPPKRVLATCCSRSGGIGWPFKVAEESVFDVIFCCIRSWMISQAPAALPLTSILFPAGPPSPCHRSIRLCPPGRNVIVCLTVRSSPACSHVHVPRISSDGAWAIAPGAKQATAATTVATRFILPPQSPLARTGRAGVFSLRAAAHEARRTAAAITTRFR